MVIPRSFVGYFFETPLPFLRVLLRLCVKIRVHYGAIRRLTTALRTTSPKRQRGTYYQSCRGANPGETLPKSSEQKLPAFA